MLSTLSTVKARLGIADFTVEFDDLLTIALTALSARFDRETNRTLTRTANSTHEFDACETEIIPPCYPSNPSPNSKPNPPKPKAGSSRTESITSSATAQLSPSLPRWRSALNPWLSAALRILEGTFFPATRPGQAKLRCHPISEQAAVEQVAYWFQNRDNLGLLRYWPKDAFTSNSPASIYCPPFQPLSRNTNAGQSEGA